MPVNVGLTFLFGGILGWIAMKILKPKPHLEGLIIATCSSGNNIIKSCRGGARVLVTDSTKHNTI